MLQDVLEELVPHYDDFQAASVVGCEKLRDSPFDDLQFEVRHLQRTAMLNAFFTNLPVKLGSFILDEDSYKANRLVYYSAKHNAELIFRRKGSIPYMSKQKQRERDMQLPLFPQEAVVNEQVAKRQIAAIWEFPPMDEDHIPTGPIAIVLRLAKEGTRLDDREWESTAVFTPDTDFIPKTTTFDPNVPDWDIDGNENDTQAEGQ